jgi:N-acetyl-anhydromuramyl-L-alanine amidase AmpD
MNIKKTVFYLTLFMQASALAQTSQQATELSKARGVGENEQGYTDNMNWVSNAKNGVTVNYAQSVDDTILKCLRIVETLDTWHAIQSMYDRNTKTWFTEGKNIKELIDTINTLTDIIDRTKNPNDGVVWNNDSTVTINGVKYSKKQLGSYRGAGAYQFMPETAILYGLEIDHSKNIDERFDKEKAKEASAKYLNGLLKRYNGNLDLALAAYNTGEKNVDAFLAGQKKLFAQETVNYVARFYSHMKDHAQYRNWVCTSLPHKQMPLLGNSKERQEKISHVVIHFVSNVAENPKEPYIVEDIYKIFSKNGLNVHYVIDRNGNIYSLVPENYVAFHAGNGSLPDFSHLTNKMNSHSIGIELLGIGTKEEMAIFLTEKEYAKIDPANIGFTSAQYAALSSLINDILARNPGILPNRKHIVGHSEYAGKRRTDPGALFDWGKLKIQEKQHEKK